MTELRERALSLLATEAAGSAPELRANAVEGLAPAPSRLRAALPAALADENLGVRAVAAMAVGRDRMGDLAARVHPLLDDPNIQVRGAAAYALRRCGEEVDPSVLAQMLRNPDAHVRAQGAFLLGELGDASALGPLRDAARDHLSFTASADARLMRLQLAEAMAKLGDGGALHEVRAALYPSRPEELEGTALAAQIMGQVKDRGAIDQLIYLTARRDKAGRPMPPEVRLAAAGSLARMGLPQGAFLAREYAVSEDPRLRAQAASVLGETGQADNLDLLLPALEDPSGIVRVAAAAAVVKITSGSREGGAGGRSLTALSVTGV